MIRGRRFTSVGEPESDNNKKKPPIGGLSGDHVTEGSETHGGEVSRGRRDLVALCAILSMGSIGSNHDLMPAKS